LIQSTSFFFYGKIYWKSKVSVFCEVIENSNRQVRIMEIVEIKRRLRDLKRLEMKLRFENAKAKRPYLIWDLFFDMRETGSGKAKYTLLNLAGMSHDQYKSVINEYWAFVYNKLVNEYDLQTGRNYDTGILLKWGLPYNADAAEVKKRFRELAKLYHPDTGGDADRFIALMEDYKKLTGR
jgi:hypothetical protein